MSERIPLRISVAMTTCQGEAHLEGQLHTILAQTRLPDEIVVCDDASTDRTLAILDGAAQRSAVPFRVHRGDVRLGLRRNVERVLGQVTGDVIVLADQDDLWAAEKLEVVEQAFAEPDVTVWFSDAELIDAMGQPMGRRAWQSTSFDQDTRRRMSEGGGLSRLLHGMTVTGAAMAVRHDVVRLALPLPERLDDPDHPYLHDGWLAVLGAVLGRVVAEPTPLTSYRQHEGQITAMSMAARTAVPDTGSGGRLRVDEERVRLVAERVRGSGDRHGMNAAARDDLFRRAEFLAARVAPVGTAGRRRRLVRLWIEGDYRAFGRGALTLLADLFARDT